MKSDVASLKHVVGRLQEGKYWGAHELLTNNAALMIIYIRLQHLNNSYIYIFSFFKYI